MTKQKALRRAETIESIDQEQDGVPTRGLIITVLALLATCTVYILWPASAAEYVGLVWVFSLIPIFLLSYYRGWKGTAFAAGATMIAFASAEFVSVYLFDQTIDWWLYGVVVVLLLIISLFVGWLSNRLISERREAIRLAFRDPLTLLPSRRALEFFLLKQVEAAHRGDEFSLVIFDLDHFKTFNDSYGHNAGDDLLERVGKVFIEYGREGDLTGRYGGEEFLSVLPGEPVEGAKVFAERIRAKIEEMDVPYSDSPTVSAGVASWTDGVEGKDQLIDRADQALYRSKSAGRNMVTVWSGSTDTID